MEFIWLQLISVVIAVDKSLNVMKPTADLVFGVDASETMRLFMEPVVDMLKNIITDYKLKSLATIKHYFALSVGNMSDLHIVYTEETDKNVLKHTDEIRFMGGKALLSTGLEGSRKLYEHYAQTNSSKLVIFTTATRPDNYTSTEIRDIKKQITLIKKDARLLIIYVGDKVQSSEWLLVFKESEIEEHVIAVSTDFLTTIHKVIYQKTDRLIKCPDGFVFLDKVCQYKTSKARYCKWDSRLYALNSTWTSSCAIFNCTEKGVVVLETLCLGFDGDCYKENEFFPCNLNGKLNWRCKCHIVEYFEEETKQTQQRIDYIIINFNKSATIANTKLEDDGSCVLPFKYRNQWNYACTDHMSVKRWCSWNMYYVQSQYSYCARQVTSQCIFEGNTYKEGDKWSVGCNQVTCSTGTPFITARCPTLNGTCVPLNADNYPCKAGNDAYKSCMCLQDNFGYGENTAIQGKISQKNNNGGGDNNGLVEYCEHKTTGKQYQVGETWTIDCFDLICLDNGVTKIQSKNCASANGKCIAPGSAEKFSCRIGNRTRDNCECGLENDELVLIANEGGKAEKKVVNSKTIIEL